MSSSNMGNIQQKSKNNGKDTRMNNLIVPENMN